MYCLKQWQWRNLLLLPIVLAVEILLKMVKMVFSANKRFEVSGCCYDKNDRYG